MLSNLAWLLAVASFGFINPTVCTDPPTSGTLKISISNIEKASGEIEIALFRGVDNYQRKGRVERVKVDREGQIEVPIKDMTFGELAIIIYHDVDADKKLDMNLLGIPKEPYGFSNNIRPRFSTPKYDECQFNFTEDGQEISIKIGGIWD